MVGENLELTNSDSATHVSRLARSVVNFLEKNLTALSTGRIGEH